MGNYKALAIQYLKLNKRRTILTILGTSMTVLILYVLLNMLFSYMDNMKEEYINLYGDYEMILYTETAEQIAQIKEDPIVEKAYIGEWFLSSEKSYENAMFIKGDSPYRIDKNFEYLTSTYEVEGEIDQFIAAFSFQGSDSSIIYILIIFSLLVAYIFAIFGVGVIRNSIQLSLFEQIKDYGNLRCIGASKSQLRAIIYTQGAIMESFGVVIGVVVGQLGMSLVGLLINFELTVHAIPIVLILIAYFGDLYFAMEENCKLVTGMSPVSALKGEFRIRKEKIKLRKKSIYGRIFGIEGDYAYKSLMRSPGKFYKSVGAMFIGITAVIACFGSVKLFDVYMDDMEDMSGYYQIDYTSGIEIDDSIESAQKLMPDTEFLKRIAEHENVTAVRKMYEAQAMLVDDNAIKDHLVDTYSDNPTLGSIYQEHEDRDEWIQLFYKNLRSTLMIYGYNEEDYARYEEHLIDGTLDVSENGIVVVNGTKTMVEMTDDQGDTMYTSAMMETAITDYQVGDTIEIVNVKKLNSMLVEEMEGKQEQAEKNGGEIDGESFMEYRAKKVEECRQALIEQGEYETYVIEGIVDRDVNINNPEFSIVLPLERYFAMTGLDENAVVGMAYHIEGDLSMEECYNFNYYNEEKSVDYYADYLIFLEVIAGMKNATMYVLVFMLFIATVSSVNIINTTASNIHMRRKEFAQLRVIGVSKEGLIKMVMLEGVITTIAANVIGIIIGNLFSYGVYYYMKMLWDVHYTIPWFGMLLGLVLSVAVLCGSVYVPLINMKQSMAEDLAVSGE
ncbi:MAG: ABC transporter permease [Lachnospiraceae bacterium]|nr:ABC transporter permease [Lachnospiraceae bacterium]